MFDLIRKHIKIMQILLFILIVPSFVLFGIDGYSRFKDQGEAVAVVDGQKILQGEWDNAHKNEIERIRVSMPSLDTKMLDTPEAKYATLERLVRDRVILVASNKLNLTASDQRLARDLQENPSIAALRKPDGSLDVERYKQLVGAQGLSPEMFEARVRSDIAARQVLAGVGASGLSNPAMADISLNAFFERREVQVARFNTPDYASKLTLTDAQLEQYYQENPAFFQAPEQANIEYVVLDIESIRKTITPNADDIKTYYEQNAQRLAGNEERRSSHILISAPNTASAAERQTAKTKADELLAQVQKSPDSFADVAKKNSQDPISADIGGDLDYLTKAGMISKSFADAAFAMKKGEISAIVESEFGYHIIRLTDIKTPKQKSFEEMRPEIETELKKQQAQKKFAEVAETFTNGVYEQADSFKAVAEKLKLEIKTANNIQRKPAPGVTGALANVKFLNAVFAPDAVDKKRNTEAVDMGTSQLASARVLQYTPARTMPFAEVKDRVKERLLAVQGAEQARKDGAAKLAAWQAAPATAATPDTLVVSREQGGKLPTPLIEASLRADASKLPALVGVDLGAQGYAIVKVTKVLERDAKPDALAQDRQQYTQWWSNAETAAYYNVLKDRYKAEIKVTKPSAKKDDALAP
jgi:peptidyl-prolyl cis-trans isomerase D